MATDLRVQLGKSQIESQSRGDSHSRWKPEAWNAAFADYRAGKRMPPIRDFVVISRGGPIDSPEKLQSLLDLPSVPEAIEANEAYDFSDSIGGTVRVCSISWDEFKELQDRTESKKIMVWLPHWLTKEPQRRVVHVVTSVKQRNTVTGDVDEKQGNI
ncbi:hypothetical protein F5Y10DRAFT_251409 [Nemania abortiva]|nr:hypothetical protein F5Y10DRAFT_251409 [Nemania abortiva]